MPFNGSGVFQRVRNWVADATAGIKVRADLHDNEDDGFAAGLTNCITKDGQSTVTQNIPWNSKRITGLADPVNPQDAATKAYADTKASLTGSVPFSGDVIIKEDSPSFTLDGKDGFKNSIFGQKGDKNRWEIVLGNATAEGGSNAGSDFQLINYADDGTLIGDVFFGQRSTGLMTVKGDPTAALGIATKQYADSTMNAANNRVLRAGDTMTGTLSTASGGTIAAAPLPGTITVMGTANAALGFYAVGYFVTNFGLGSDGNFWMGGGSYGAGVQYRFWTTRDFASTPTVAARLVMLTDVALPYNDTWSEYPNGIITGLHSRAWQGYGQIDYYRVRALQLQTTGGWFTVGYA